MTAPKQLSGYLGLHASKDVTPRLVAKPHKKQVLVEEASRELDGAQIAWGVAQWSDNIRLDLAKLVYYCFWLLYADV